jgi:hypothetical protein
LKSCFWEIFTDKLSSSARKKDFMIFPENRLDLLCLLKIVSSKEYSIFSFLKLRKTRQSDCQDWQDRLPELANSVIYLFWISGDRKELVLESQSIALTRVSTNILS